MDPYISAALGVQFDVLPELLGGNAARNVLGRFTVVSTQEFKALEELDERTLEINLEPWFQSIMASFEAVATGIWGGDTAFPREVDIGLTNARVLLKAYNTVLRAARDHGLSDDPMVAWARKADEYIFRLCIGLWLEMQGDLKRLNPEFQMAASNSMPVILAFMTCSLFCFLAAAYLFCSMRMFFSCKGFRHESKSFMRAPGLHILRSPLLGCEGSHQ